MAGLHSKQCGIYLFIYLKLASRGIRIFLPPTIDIYLFIYFEKSCVINAEIISTENKNSIQIRGLAFYKPCCY